jgi:hypothetical protein
MAQGLAFGAGSSVARHAVDSVFNSFSGDKNAAVPAAVAPAPAVPQPSQQFSGACSTDQLAFTRCLQENPSNASNCDHYFTALQACQNRN